MEAKAIAKAVTNAIKTPTFPVSPIYEGIKLIRVIPMTIVIEPINTLGKTLYICLTSIFIKINPKIQYTIHATKPPIATAVAPPNCKAIKTGETKAPEFDTYMGL